MASPALSVFNAIPGWARHVLIELLGFTAGSGYLFRESEVRPMSNLFNRL